MLSRVVAATLFFSLDIVLQLCINIGEVLQLCNGLDVNKKLKIKLPMGKNGKISTGLIISALQASGGHMTNAAQTLGVSVANISQRVKKSEELQKALADITAVTTDLAVGQIKKHIEQGNLSACIYWTKCHAKDRGFTERQEITGRNGGPIEQAFSFNQELEAQILDRLRDDNRPTLRQLNSPPKLVTNGNC